MSNGAGSHTSRFVQILFAVVLSVIAIYFGRPILLPLAMAVLLTFLLKPLVNGLERRGLPRPAAIIALMCVLLIVIAGIGWQVLSHLNDLANNLDSYKSNLTAKVADLRGSESVFSKIRETVEEVDESTSKVQNEVQEGAEDLADEVPGDDGPATAETVDEDLRGEPEQAGEPLRVQVVPEPDSPMETLQAVAGSVGGPLAILAVVTVLTIFMLVEFEELRNRLVRLVGTAKITVTTKTIDEAGKRISRYLLMNALVNGGFGLTVGVGLWLFGVHYAALWGFLAAALRFVPYIGPIAAAVMPICMAVIQFPNWTQPLLVAGYFVVIELITNNVIEPLTYGRSAGVSMVALLVAATFWTWVWGPLGLMLSVPMTVVLAVLGRHIPQLEPLAILLGDAPALPPHASYYQRLLAGDVDEAGEILEERFGALPRDEVFDSLVVPALSLAERDRNRGVLSDEDKDYIWQSTRELIEELAPAAGDVEASPERTIRPVRVVGCPTHDTADELALVMLQQVAPAKVDMTILPVEALASEVLASLVDEPPDLVCISALGPGGSAQTRYLCKRIRQALPVLRILVGRWDYRGDRARMTAALKRRGASDVATSLQETCDILQRMQPLPAAASSVPPPHTPRAASASAAHA